MKKKDRLGSWEVQDCKGWTELTKACRAEEGEEGGPRRKRNREKKSNKLAPSTKNGGWNKPEGRNKGVETERGARPICCNGENRGNGRGETSESTKTDTRGQRKKNATEETSREGGQCTYESRKNISAEGCFHRN